MRITKSTKLYERCKKFIKAFAEDSAQSHASFRPSSNGYSATSSIGRCYYDYAACHHAVHALKQDDRDVATVDMDAIEDALADMEGAFDYIEDSTPDDVTKLLVRSFSREVHRVQFARANLAENSNWFTEALALREEGYDYVASFGEAADSRDFLEFMWRAMVLRSSDGSHVGAKLKNGFHAELSKLDRDLKLLFGDQRFPEFWADESFWWRMPLVKRKE